MSADYLSIIAGLVAEREKVQGNPAALAILDELEAETKKLRSLELLALSAEQRVEDMVSSGRVNGSAAAAAELNAIAASVPFNFCLWSPMPSHTMEGGTAPKLSPSTAREFYCSPAWVAIGDLEPKAQSTGRSITGRLAAEATHPLAVEGVPHVVTAAAEGAPHVATAAAGSGGSAHGASPYRAGQLEYRLAHVGDRPERDTRHVLAVKLLEHYAPDAAEYARVAQDINYIMGSRELNRSKDKCVDNGLLRALNGGEFDSKVMAAKVSYQQQGDLLGLRFDRAIEMYESTGNAVYLRMAKDIKGVASENLHIDKREWRMPKPPTDGGICAGRGGSSRPEPAYHRPPTTTTLPAQHVQPFGGFTMSSGWRPVAPPPWAGRECYSEEVDGGTVYHFL